MPRVRGHSTVRQARIRRGTRAARAATPEHDREEHPVASISFLVLIGGVVAVAAVVAIVVGIAVASSRKKP